MMRSLREMDILDTGFFHYASDCDMALRMASCGIRGVQLDVPYGTMDRLHTGGSAGRGGRNIRPHFEKATGVDVIVDDTPGIVIVTGFDNIRREIAKLSLEKLIQDGRIHPTRIEEVVRETQEEMGAAHSPARPGRRARGKRAGLA